MDHTVAWLCEGKRAVK